jgi:hypothetical protein
VTEAEARLAALLADFHGGGDMATIKAPGYLLQL